MDTSLVFKLKEQEQKFIQIYNSDFLMQRASEGYPLIKEIIELKKQIYNTEMYTNWVEDKLIMASILERVSVKISTFVGLDEGLKTLQEAIDLMNKDESLKNCEELSKMYKLQAGLFEKNQNFEKAFTAYENASNILNKLIQESTDQKTQHYFAKMQAATYRQFGILCQNLQFYKEAETLLTVAFNLWKNIEGKEIKSLEYVSIAKQIGELSIESGKYDQAFQYLNACEQVIGGKTDQISASLHCSIFANLGKFYYVIHNYNKSFEYTKKAEEIMNQYQIQPTDKLQILEQKVTVQYMMKQHNEGLQTIEEGIKLCEQYNKFEFFYLKFLFFQGLINQTQQNYQKALETGEKLLKDAQKVYGDENEHIADAYRIIAHAQLQTSEGKQIDECLANLKKAGNIYAQIGPKVTDYMYCLEDTIRYGQDYDKLQAARDACVDLKVIRKQIMENLKQNEERINEELELVDQKIKELDGKIAQKK
ncbi:hypothetical protein PPERSA_09636 [Pseudocohnilembus persalinus]|uniref:Tetratricopeptide repeat protein n=1 Tax=Pseudocohnilembus persalinus TaxID=266149 RepID=A0A0V0QFP6_PSEPJ|nr:hypothetical protein PPERSA_09636 [Pseudocohnilembus persalinus]|eukprot:KRX01030.1 hypothetical protein PPERSA_09636 [Pseudocohnilembus persalinus]